MAGARTIHVPDPSWGNHGHIFRSAGLEVQNYAYLDHRTGTTLDFDGMRAALSGLPRGSVVLLHACAHNPTGIDPSGEQWQELAELFAGRGLVALFDSAYQGYASGDLDADAASVRAFEAAGVLPVACQSYAKSLGLYGERIGAVNFVCASREEAEAVLSTVKQTIVRPAYSSPPLHGARLAAEALAPSTASVSAPAGGSTPLSPRRQVLGDAALFAQWRGELRGMANRVHRMRVLLADALRAEGAPSPDGGDWGHVVDQIGMFAYTGLSASHVDSLRERHHVYLTRDGRMSMAAMKPADIEYVARAVRSVLAE
uniref:Aspartate aminotransferase n=1 Tax=Emiliania huxleyi TaxID=2903 RepID=Q0MYV1_EMIHU|nr:aspartate aminotransferase [Emiliania huxleyi]